MAINEKQRKYNKVGNGIMSFDRCKSDSVDYEKMMYIIHRRIVGEMIYIR